MRTNSLHTLAFLAAAAAAAAAAASSAACTRTCANDFDCSGEGYCTLEGRCEIQCFTDEDCRHPPSCAEGAGPCIPLGLRCDSVNKCRGTGPGMHTTKPAPPTAEMADGFADPPGTGYTFIVNRLSIASRENGLDVDGSCAEGRDHNCSDNALADLGDYGNAQINIGVQQGDTLLLIELAGVDHPYKGSDDDITVKIYAARDADDPPVSANNFAPIPNSSGACCDFKIAPGSLNADRRPRSVLPARIENGHIISLRPTVVDFTLTIGQPPQPEVVLERALISGRLAPDLSRIDDGILAGAIPMHTLATTQNPYCKVLSDRCTRTFQNSTLLDLVTALVRRDPDIDLDFNHDGLECVLDTDGDGHIDKCCDGAGNAECTDVLRRSCTGREIGPFDPADPSSCVFQPDLADGYSVAINFTAIPAHIVSQ